MTGSSWNQTHTMPLYNASQCMLKPLPSHMPFSLHLQGTREEKRKVINGKWNFEMKEGNTISTFSTNPWAIFALIHFWGCCYDYYFPPSRMHSAYMKHTDNISSKYLWGY